jgi:CRP-like cAMP-binding protein
MTHNDELIALALKYGRLVKYKADEVIHKRGDFKVGLSVVYSGQVRVGNYGLDGRYQLTSILHMGDSFGEFTLFANLPRTHDAEANTNAEVIQLTLAQYQQLAQCHPKIERMLLKSLASKLHQALELLDDAKRLPTHTRLAKLLFTMSMQQNTTHLNLKQNQCAQVLGVTVLSAHKALHKLQNLGLVKTAYGAVDIVDSDVLQEWLEGQSSILLVLG